MQIESIQDILKIARSETRNRMAIAAADDKDVLLAAKAAWEKKVVHPVLVGNADKIAELAKEIDFNLKNIEVIDAATVDEAVDKCVAEVAGGRVQVLMKGQVNTATFLRAVLNKQYGLRKGGLLSHVGLQFPKAYHKPIMITDAALNVAPTLAEKMDIITNAVNVMHKLGVAKPRVAILAHNEIPTDKVPASMEALQLKQMNAKGEIPNCIIDGPMALDVAISKEACEHKGLQSAVGGNADILLCPEIISANVLYKALVFFGHAKSASIITGATVPIVVTSRSEDADTKLLSITLAVQVH